ncbi:MAG: hypothetical protein OHK0029_09920 [Armatimonadaceae bacterium]
MVRKGYIEQQIEEMGRFLRQLLLKRTEDAAGVAGEAEEIRDAAKLLTGLDLNTVVSLPESYYLSLFEVEGQVHSGNAAIVGTLLIEEADALERTEQATPEEIRTRYIRAKTLLSAALAQADYLRTPELVSRLAKAHQRLQNLP